MSATPLFEARAITKRFGDFTANRQVDFAIHAGEIHALLGENGAGKSTFVKMVYGVLQPDEGQFLFEGKPVTIQGPQAARQMGIGMVFQHFSQFEALSVAENIQLAMEAGESLESLSARIESLSASYGIPIAADKLVADLSVGEQQRVEILRCLLQSPKLLIMDEPTSVLTPQETQQLFTVIRKLADEGCAILFISHKLDEIKALCQKATILRGGLKIDTLNSKSKSKKAIAELMVGSAISDIKRQSSQIGTKALFEVAGLNRPAQGPFDVTLSDVGFSLYEGQILGIAGISGNGQDELMGALTGEWRDRHQIAKMSVMGEDLRSHMPETRRQKGVGFIPEDRNGHAAVPAMRLSENTLMTSHSSGEMVVTGLVRHQSVQAQTQMIISDFDVRTPEADPLASALSGGNLQKFVVGREIQKQPKVLIVSQPTWGVDIGAAQLIRTALLALAQKGSAILLISQDLEEIFAISSHIAVLHGGRLSQAYEAGEMTPESVGLLMGGEQLGNHAKGAKSKKTAKNGAGSRL
ncbi:MAG: ABC transporter ATP-binding protein [Candidatus Puniceispirillaceae bacterium]